MSRNALWILCALTLMCANVDAALRYEYREDLIAESRIDSKNMTARAVLDGERGRIDILTGNRYQPGSFILRDGNVRLFFVYPDRKQFSEVQLPKGPNREVANRISIANPKINFEDVEAGPLIAGYPTRHYRLTTSYEMSLSMGTVIVRQKVEATIDRWTTTAFDETIAKYLDESDLLTGKPDVDALITAESSKFKGLTLKLRSVVRTTPEQRMQGSKLNLPSTKQRIREMEVTKIEEVKVSPDIFSIPAGFKPATDVAPNTSAHYLTMEPTQK